MSRDTQQIESRRSDSDSKWKALVGRNRKDCGVFWYGVRSTGIYCVVGCASRRPKRENVEFFESSLGAEREGYRACKRCKPNNQINPNDLFRRLRSACDVLANSRDSSAVARAREASGYSEAQFRRVFKQTIGVTPKKYQQAVRRIKLHTALAVSGSIDQAINNAGFETPSRVYDEVNHLLGMSPSAFCRGGPGEVIRFAINRCDLGEVLVALTARGICAVLIGDTPSSLRSELSNRFQSAILYEDETLGEYLAIVLALIESPQIGCTLPIDIRGTAFQELVWNHLRNIQPGTTQNYAEVARSIGKPKSARAVARACGSNSLAVVVPCHRVVGSDGRLKGFRWGVERKAELIRREQQGDM